MIKNKATEINKKNVHRVSKSFSKIDTYILEMIMVNATALTVYMYLTKTMNHKTGICCPALSTIAEHLHMSKSTVSRAITFLKEKNVLGCQTVREGKWEKNYYYFKYPSATSRPALDDSVEETASTEEVSKVSKSKNPFSNMTPSKKISLPIVDLSKALEKKKAGSINSISKDVTTKTSKEKGTTPVPANNEMAEINKVIKLAKAEVKKMGKKETGLGERHKQLTAYIDYAENQKDNITYNGCDGIARETALCAVAKLAHEIGVLGDYIILKAYAYELVTKMNMTTLEPALYRIWFDGREERVA